MNSHNLVDVFDLMSDVQKFRFFREAMIILDENEFIDFSKEDKDFYWRETGERFREKV